MSEIIKQLSGSQQVLSSAIKLRADVHYIHSVESVEEVPDSSSVLYMLIKMVKNVFRIFINIILKIKFVFLLNIK